MLKIIKRFKHSVDLSIKNGIAEVRLRSHRKNALSLSMMGDLSNLLDDLAQNHGQAAYGLILSGENNTFCTGFDLKSLASDPGKIAAEMCSIMHGNYLKFTSLPMVTIAAIEGYAIGGGAELTAWADHRIMSETATVRFVQVKMGVSPGWAGGVALTNVVGRSKALQMLNGTLKMNGKDAKEFGFVDQVAEPGTTIVQARKLLKKYFDSADGSINAIKGIKEALIADPELLRAALLRERRSFVKLWGAEDNQKAIKKSLEKI